MSESECVPEKAEILGWGLPAIFRWSFIHRRPSFLSSEVIVEPCPSFRSGHHSPAHRHTPQNGCSSKTGRGVILVVYPDYMPVSLLPFSVRPRSSLALEFRFERTLPRRHSSLVHHLGYIFSCFILVVKISSDMLLA